MTKYQRFAVANFLKKLSEHIELEYEISGDAITAASKVGQFTVSLNGTTLTIRDDNLKMSQRGSILPVYGGLKLKYPNTFPLDTPGGLIWQTRSAWNPLNVFRGSIEEIESIFRDEGVEIQEFVNFMGFEIARVRMGNYNDIDGLIYGVFKKEICLYVIPVCDYVKNEVVKIIDMEKAKNMLDHLRIVKGDVSLYEILQRQNETSEDQEE